MNTQRPIDEQQEADRPDRAYKAWLAGASAATDDVRDNELNPASAQTACAWRTGRQRPGPTPEFAVAPQGHWKLPPRLRPRGGAAQAPECLPLCLWRNPCASGRRPGAGCPAGRLSALAAARRSTPRRSRAAPEPHCSAAGIQSYFLAEQRSVWVSNEKLEKTQARGSRPSRSAAKCGVGSKPPTAGDGPARPKLRCGRPARGNGWNSTTVSDGSSQYDYDAAAHTVSINVAAADLPDAASTGASSLAQLFERMETCYYRR